MREWCEFFNQSRGRDLAVISTSTFTGALIGALTSIDGSTATMFCNILCDSAYGAYTGIGLSLGLIVLDCITSRRRERMHSQPIYNETTDLGVFNRSAVDVRL